MQAGYRSIHPDASWKKYLSLFLFHSHDLLRPIHILACLFREGPTAEMPESVENLPGIQRAILYLEMHFKENITLPMLAQEAGFNATYFSELFRKTTGQSYKQRLTELRVRYAKMLLKNGVSVSSACFESGFGSLSNFNAVFKQVYGITPRQYQLSR